MPSANENTSLLHVDSDSFHFANGVWNEASCNGSFESVVTTTTITTTSAVPRRHFDINQTPDDGDEFLMADKEVFELRMAEAKLAALEDNLDEMWKNPEYWTTHFFGDTYSNPSDPRFMVPNRHKVLGHRHVHNLARNNAQADALAKLLACEKKHVEILRAKMENSAKQRNGGKRADHVARAAFLARRGMEHCRTRWLEVDAELKRHNKILDGIVADPQNWHVFNNMFIKGPSYCAQDDYRMKIDNSDGHLDAVQPHVATLCASGKTKSFVNRQVLGHHTLSYRGMRLKRQFEELTKEKKDLEAAINKLSGY